MLLALAEISNTEWVCLHWLLVHQKATIGLIYTYKQGGPVPCSQLFSVLFYMHMQALPVCPTTLSQ